MASLTLGSLSGTLYMITLFSLSPLAGPFISNGFYLPLEFWHCHLFCCSFEISLFWCFSSAIDCPTESHFAVFWATVSRVSSTSRHFEFLQEMKLPLCWIRTPFLWINPTMTPTYHIYCPRQACCVRVYLLFAIPTISHSVHALLNGKILTSLHYVKTAYKM